MSVRKIQPVLLTALGALALPAMGSELSYTFLDFQSLSSEVDAAGVQNPVPLQTVSIAADKGDGIAVGGSMATGDHFYIGGVYQSSVVDLRGSVSSPLTDATFVDQFDLTLGRLSLGYVRPIGENFDLIAEISYDSVTYDFGSIAGESFDLDESGIGAQFGFRWNAIPALELFAFARQSPLARTNLSALEFESDSTIHAGLRWYFFEDLGLGLEFESGEVETTTISMRFSFGNLPW